MTTIQSSINSPTVRNSQPLNDLMFSVIDNLIFDTEAYNDYMTDLNYSQGFYVTDDGSMFLGGIRPIRECSDLRYEKAEAAARFAVEEENKKRGENHCLKFIKIVNLNYEPCAGAIYYVTLAAEEQFSGEMKHFQAKIREKLNTGYQVQVFRVAPYSENSSERIGGEDCCVWVRNLEPWMDESYLFYKCFFRYIRQELSDVKIVHNEKTGKRDGILRFPTREAANNVLKKYDGKRMPRANQCYILEIAQRN